MSPRALKTYALNQSSRTAKNEFETGGSVGFFAAERGMVMTEFLRALMELHSVTASNSSECHCCAKMTKRT